MGKPKQKPIITDKVIEQFYNKGRASDVPYTKIHSISPRLQETIVEILINKGYTYD